MLNRQYNCFIGCESEYKDAQTVIFGAPFDSTTSYRPGTRFAAKAIRSESFGIETYSPYQDKDLCDILVMDSGDLDFPFGNTARVLDMIEERTAAILADGKKPLMIGGEHLVTLGALRAAVKKYPDLHIIHFDAHCDLRDNYIGDQLSHATVIRRAWELVGDGRIFQFGIRSGDRAEFEFAKAHTYLHKFDLSTFEGIADRLQFKPVYFTLDLDVLDSSVFPGTGTPEAGGIGFNELVNAIKKLKDLNIIGCDMNELCPVYDPSGASTAAACKILRELLLAIN
ncbi:MAG TPA: agmatinase [Bacillota bacterium]|nr:agmatinase [Bacillota bacterium]HOK68618.1 agmatinase [Bacillota bacterium]HPP84730.1 agmatinase [Bacillota bacterium]